MLKTRVIPTLLMKDLGLVKGVGFDSWRRVGTALPAVKVYNARDVDELIVLDIAATAEARELDFPEIADLASESFVPLTVGGGIADVEGMRRALRVGADKIAVNSAAYRQPEVITDGARQFGSQCIVVSIDAKKLPDGTYRCFSKAATQDELIDPVSWARKVEMLGAGEILLTSIDRDGTMRGYDLDLISRVTQSVSIPVIASGGAGTYEDFFLAIQSGAAAVAAASLFHFTEQTPAGARDYLRKKGIQVRNSAI